MKISLFIAACIAFCLADNLNSVPDNKPSGPVYVQYFNSLDTLLPDYAISDTLIVVEWYELNKAIAFTEQQKDFGSDQDVDSLFHAHCVGMDAYRKAVAFADNDASVLNDELKEALYNPNY